ncbi:unnamed protein product [Staurois parvus]|uniref:Uncharacterized protein n=1 Tax=Staurois parvus TaxID=386267 RepID=A0ABN9B858_9NEOB|nr:unnamed protein product [Staurois parvus]
MQSMCSRCLVLVCKYMDLIDSQIINDLLSGMDSALVVGLTCRVGCSTRADQRVLSAARSSLLQQSANTWG